MLQFGIEQPRNFSVPDRIFGGIRQLLVEGLFKIFAPAFPLTGLIRALTFSERVNHTRTLFGTVLGLVKQLLCSFPNAVRNRRVTG